jgi:hypothetical protein
MTTDPRVQKFYDEANAARKELRRLAMDIAGWRIDHADRGLIYLPSPASPPLAVEVCPDVVWALKNGRLDIAARIIEMVDQYNNSMGSAEMMQARVDHETHMKAVRAREEGDGPEYLEDEEDPGVIRFSPEEAKSAFSSLDED